MDKVRTNKSSSNGRRLALLLGVLAASSAVAWVLLPPALPGVDRTSIRIGVAEQAAFVRDVLAPGKLTAEDGRWVAAAVDGKIEKVLLNPGDSVSVGQTIALASNPELDRAAEQARWDLSAASAELTAERAEFELQRMDHHMRLMQTEAEHDAAALEVEAQRELIETNAVSLLALRQSELRLRQLASRLKLERNRVAVWTQARDAQLRAREATVGRLENALAQREHDVEALAIRAPMAGIVRSIEAEAGQRIPTGFNVARIVDPGSLLAQVRVPEHVAREITPGQRAAVDLRNVDIDGIVKRVHAGVDSGTVLVDIQLSSLPAGARSDLSLAARIIIEERGTITSIPRPTGAEAGATLAVFKLNERRDAAQRTVIRLGELSATRAEIVDGLAAGDHIVLSDTSDWDRFDAIALQ